MKTTIYEIAKQANVSIATVSRAINPETRAKVASETLQLIEEVIEKRGYTPNIAAKNLGKAKFKAIGIIFPHHAGIFLEDYYSKILCGAADGLLETDYRLKTVMLKCHKPSWDKYNFQIGEGLDGMIVTHWKAFFSEKSCLEKMNLPTVIINDIEHNIRACFVSADHFLGGRLVAEHLYSMGHRDIIVMTGPQNSSDSRNRLEGFKSFMEQKRVTISSGSIVCGEFQEEKAYSIIEEVLKQNKKATAIFCLNDGMAFGVLRKLKELKIRCPEQISVVGYDGDRRGENTKPALTTIQVPIYDLAKRAIELLTKHLDGTASKKKKEFYSKNLLPVKLIERNSVRKIT